jgi:hypothetical protein
VVRANPDAVKTAQDLIAQGAAVLKNIDADKVNVLAACVALLVLFWRCH